MTSFRPLIDCFSSDANSLKLDSLVVAHEKGEVTSTTFEDSAGLSLYRSERLFI